MHAQDQLDTNTKKELLDFLNRNPMAVISTKSDSSEFPESALIAFAEYGSFEIIFETFNISRKYQNLLQNNKVSLVIGLDHTKLKTIQYQGVAELIPEDEVESSIQYFLDKDTPCTEKILRDNRARLFKITPTWLRYSDYTNGPPRILEFSF